MYCIIYPLPPINSCQAIFHEYKGGEKHMWPSIVIRNCCHVWINEIYNASSFNEIVTLDLKQFGDKYVLGCIDPFTRFIQGKLLKNKKAETVINAINECWNLPFGIPGVEYYADNGT